MERAFNSAQLVEETEKSEDQQGWLATFADLMSLLMCFFVLLLSFSELDVIKFKQIAGSMKTAFGVQRDIVLEEPPKGTSVIKQEFSPAISEPTLLNQIKQKTTDVEAQKLASNESDGHQQDDKSGRDRDAFNNAQFELKQKIERTLEEELRQGRFELDQHGQQLIIRMPEEGFFASGSGYLQPMFIPSLNKLAGILKDIPGQIVVAGHTDDLPVNNELYRDNLELSSVRAIAVARVLKKSGRLKFIQANGMADSQPLVENRSSSNRSKNRRVEITIVQGKAETQDLSLTSSVEKKDG